MLIVLGGALLDPGLLGTNSYWRSIYALQAWRAGGFHDIFLTGGSDPQSPVATLMADFLKSQGVPAAAIHVETRSNSTRENATFSKPLLDQLPGTRVLLTSDYHMYRAVRVFEKAGITVLPRPFPDARKRGSTWTGRWPAFNDLVMETAKIAYYRWKGWI
ncbi:MAG: YdcF family protein [Bryobacteraceae bacterium]